jgi:hypothetical protein
MDIFEGIRFKKSINIHTIAKLSKQVTKVLSEISVSSNLANCNSSKILLKRCSNLIDLMIYFADIDCQSALECFSFKNWEDIFVNLFPLLTDKPLLNLINIFNCYLKQNYINHSSSNNNNLSSIEIITNSLLSYISKNKINEENNVMHQWCLCCISSIMDISYPTMISFHHNDVEYNDMSTFIAIVILESNSIDAILSSSFIMLNQFQLGM